MEKPVPLQNESTVSTNSTVFWDRLVRPSLAVPVVVVVASVIFFWSLGEAAYWDRDEPRNAGCAAEMMARGNWIVPTFNDELRQQKPALLYWLMGVAYSIFGQNEFAGRFFSALLGVGTVVATWGISRRYFGSAVAILAGLILCSNVMFGVAARAATPDSLLIFCVTMALCCFALKQSSDTNPFNTRIGFWGTYGFLGLAMLSKGPVGFVLPMAVMGWFLLQRDWLATASDASSTKGGIWRQLAEPFYPKRFIRVLFSMRPISGVCLSLAIAAPWFVAVGLATDGEFLRRFFLDENFGRATQVLENHHGGVWFYPVAILAGFFPWSMFWGPAVVDLFFCRKLSNDSEMRRCSECDGARFAIFWVVIQVVAFSCVQTKLPSYVTPCYPALSMLTAFALTRLANSASLAPKWVWASANTCLVLSGIGLIVGFSIGHKYFEAIPVWLALSGLAPIVMGFADASTGWTICGQRIGRNAIAVAMAVLFCIILLGVGAGSIGKTNRMALTEHLSSQAGLEVATYGCLESSWIYYGKRRLLELRTDGKEDPHAVDVLEARKFWQRKPWLSPQQFADTNHSGLVITTEELLPQLKEKLPEDWKVVQAANWFLKDKTLVLVGKRSASGSQGFSASLKSAIPETTR